MASLGEVQRALARFQWPNGTAAGAGFLVSGNRVLTCAHVVNFALDRGINNPTKPVDPVRMSFQYSNVQAVGRVVQWDRARDYALLQLEGDLDISPVRLLRQDTLDEAWGHQVRVVGYPDNDEHFSKARLGGELADGRWELHKDDGPFVAQGFSGGLIWNVALCAVVGMLESIEETEKQRARCWPTAALVNAIPELNDACDVAGSESRLPVSRGADLVTPHMFDLQRQVMQINNYIGSRGLFGFNVEYSDNIALNNLRLRLQHEFKCDALSCWAPLHVHSRAQPPKRVLDIIANKVTSRENSAYLIFIVSGLTSGLEEFWNGLKAALGKRMLASAIVIIFALEDDAQVPEEIHTIPPLHFFERGEVNQWIRDIVFRKGWERISDAVDYWLQTVEQSCTYDEGSEMVGVRLAAGTVYDHIEFTSRELESVHSFGQWREKLKQWSSNYAYPPTGYFNSISR